MKYFGPLNEIATFIQCTFHSNAHDFWLLLGGGVIIQQAESLATASALSATMILKNVCIKCWNRMKFQSHRIKINVNFLWNCILYVGFVMHTETRIVRKIQSIPSRTLFYCQLWIVCPLAHHPHTTCRGIRNDCFVKCSPMPVEKASNFNFRDCFFSSFLFFIS